MRDTSDVMILFRDLGFVTPPRADLIYIYIYIYFFIFDFSKTCQQSLTRIAVNDIYSSYSAIVYFRHLFAIRCNYRRC